MTYQSTHLELLNKNINTRLLKKNVLVNPCNIIYRDIQYYLNAGS